MPIARAQEKFYVRSVTSGAIALEKSSGHVITIPPIGSRMISRFRMMLKAHDFLS
jgi:hypothetical protein